MAFREVGVTEIREVLRAWLAGAGLRRAAEQAGVARKTARRSVEAAVVAAGLARDGGGGGGGGGGRRRRGWTARRPAGTWRPRGWRRGGHGTAGQGSGPRSWSAR